ncbi:hypothetical protein BJX64DRAFT_275485 [Aspergillus heterothallicus]
MKRVEWNGRLKSESPWSIRQTGVYQKLTQSKRSLEDAKALFVLVAPSSTAETSVLNELSKKESDQADSTGSALLIHGCIVTESLKGWVDYMCWLEEQLKLKSARIMTSSIYGGSDTRPIQFVEKDRQGLKQLEEYINDLLVILRNKVDTIGRIKRSCQQYCSVHRNEKQPCICQRAMEELEEHAAEAQNYQDRVKVLQTEVQSVQNCLSDLLRYRESADIKQLTVGPTLIMNEINFFSTQFVTTVGGGLQVSVYALVMVAVAAPLTGLVFLGWRFWLQREYSRFRPNLSQEERV